MDNMNEIVRLAVDAYHGKTAKYSVDESMDTLRQALIAANNGSTRLNYKAIRDGKCPGLFTLIEEVLSRTVVEGLQESDFFNQFVDFRNVALGDKNLFIVKDSDMYTVADIAAGTQGIRRQRLVGSTSVSINTVPKAVKIYEELDRVLSGQSDFNEMISDVAEAFQYKLLEDIYATWIAATAEDMGGSVYFPAAGAYDEDTLLELIAHVEAAANGKTATILGTAKAVRNLVPAIQGAESKSDIYTKGVYTYFYGTPVMVIPQRHKVNSTEFLYPDNLLTIVAGDDKPIKVEVCFYAA